MQYEKQFPTWDGQNAQSLCRFRDMLDMIIRSSSLNSATPKFTQMPSLLKGTVKSNWNAVLGNMDPAAINTNAGWDQTLSDFTLNYCEPDARRQQWIFMNRHLGLAQPLSVQQL